MSFAEILFFGNFRPSQPENFNFAKLLTNLLDRVSFCVGLDGQRLNFFAADV